jgi:hypothetical protein
MGTVSIAHMKCLHHGQQACSKLQATAASTQPCRCQAYFTTVLIQAGASNHHANTADAVPCWQERTALACNVLHRSCQLSMVARTEVARTEEEERCCRTDRQLRSTPWRKGLRMCCTEPSMLQAANILRSAARVTGACGAHQMWELLHLF